MRICERWEEGKQEEKYRVKESDRQRRREIRETGKVEQVGKKIVLWGKRKEKKKWNAGGGTGEEGRIGGEENGVVGVIKGEEGKCAKGEAEAK